LKRRTFVVGGKCLPFIGKGHPDFIGKGHPDFGKKENPSLEQQIEGAVKGCFQETKVSPTSVDKAWIGNFAGELFSSQGHLGAAVVGSCPELMFKPVTRVESACASGGVAFSGAVESIQAGYDVCLVVGAEVQNTVSARQGGDYLARAAHYRSQRKIDDFTFPAMFAQRIKAYLERFPYVKLEDIAHVSVKAYANANRNPLAHMRATKMTYEMASTAGEKNPNFLKNQELSHYLRMSDCSQVSDGACAIIIASEDGLKRVNRSIRDTIEVMTVQQSTGNLYEVNDLSQLLITKDAADKAYKALNINASQIQIAEVHDCFSIAEIQMYEALGFAPYGKGVDLVKQGHTNIEGRIPVNTGGGLIGFGHPVGATGVKQILEIYKQMMGICGDYQVPRIPQIGLTANMGGSDKTVVVSILSNNNTRSKY